MARPSFGLNSRHPLSPTKGLLRFTFFWTVTSFALASALGVLLAVAGPRLGL